MRSCGAANSVLYINLYSTSRGNGLVKFAISRKNCCNIASGTRDAQSTSAWLDLRMWQFRKTIASPSAVRVLSAPTNPYNGTTHANRALRIQPPHNQGLYTYSSAYIVRQTNDCTSSTIRVQGNVWALKLLTLLSWCVCVHKCHRVACYFVSVLCN